MKKEIKNRIESLNEVIKILEDHQEKYPEYKDIFIKSMKEFEIRKDELQRLQRKLNLT